MNTMNDTSNLASQTVNVLSQPLPELPGAVAPSFNNAIALQQHHFQQTLVDKQLLAQEQAVAHAVSIKAAAERAAARAAEISKLLQEETNDLPMEKAQEPSLKREKSVSKSCSKSQSPQPSRSKSISPVRSSKKSRGEHEEYSPRGHRSYRGKLDLKIRSKPPSPQPSRSNSISPARYRKSRREHEEYSPRGQRSYRTSRRSSYYSRYGDHWGYSRSNYRRDDRFGGRSYSYYRGARNRSRSRKRSPSRYRFLRYDESHSPRRHRSRSPSHEFRHQKSSKVTTRRSVSRSPINSGHRKSLKVARRRSMSKSPINSSSSGSSPRHTRVTRRHSVSRSPINSNSISSSPPHTRSKSPRKSIPRSLSSSDNSQSRSTTSLVKGNIVDDDSASDLDVKQRERKARPSTDKLIGNRSYYSRSGSISSDHSGKRNSKELENPVSGKLGSANRNYSSSRSQSTQRASRSRDDKSNSVMPVSTRSTKDVDSSTQMLDYHRSRNDRNVGNRYNDRLELPCNRPSHSPDDSLSIHGHKKYLNERKENMDDAKYVSKEIHKSNKLDSPGHERPRKVIGGGQDSAYFPGVETDERNMVKNNPEGCPDVFPMEAYVNNNVHSIGGISDNGNLPGECAIYPLPETDGSTDEREVAFDPLVTQPDEVARVDAEKVPIGCKYPGKTYKLRSTTKEKKQKHSKRHDKRHHRKYTERDDDCRKENRKERKLKRHESKNHRKHHKSHKESKSRKRKYRDMSSSSSSDDSSSSDEKSRR